MLFKKVSCSQSGFYYCCAARHITVTKSLLYHRLFCVCLVTLHHELNQGAWECNFEESMEFFAAYNIYVTGIKNLCQVLYMCVCLVTLRNVGEVLEFATTYNAEQLQQVCQQFIRLNLPALLENRFAFFSCHGTESKQNIFWQIWGVVYGSAHFFCALF